MNIGDCLHLSDGAPPFSREPSPCGEDGGLWEDLAFILLLPRMRSILDALNQGDAPRSAPFPDSSSGARYTAPLLDILGNNVILLQESFTNRLYAALRHWDIDTSAKLTLRLDDEAGLCLEGEHPEKERISTMLAAVPEYSEIFAEIAIQSAALRELRNLRTMTLYDRARDSYAALVAATPHSHYQMSLKGEMNHFYFTR